MTEATTGRGALAAHETVIPFGQEELVLGTGKLAKQANATVVASVGGTVALVSVVMAGPRDIPLDFFPLTVDYREKAYAAGKVPGGYFKRESRPSDGEVLRARLIDRPLRPMFPENFRQEIQIYVNILSYDGKNSADVAALTAASAALLISDIPFESPVSAVRVGYDGSNYILNPNIEQQKTSKLDLIVAGTRKAITMVESGADILTEEQMLGALRFGHEAIIKICDAQEEMRKAVGKPKSAYNIASHDEALVSKVHSLISSKLEAVASIFDKQERNDAIKAARDGAIEALAAEYPDSKNAIKSIFEEEYSRTMREAVLNTGKRADGRSTEEIRQITVDTSVLPRTHGSAVFTRGQTQSLGVLTLGTGEDTQGIDDLEEIGERTFYMHYNFPSFSVGEVRPVRGPGRREIGHGALAERSIRPVVPSHDKFPYTIRLVSEILESNGSSSMASVCSGILAMMDGGVPIKAPVAGIAMGLILEGDRYAVLSDIMGLEDHLGDMDFKVAGTEEGITALQMDIKIEGVTLEIMEKALAQARDGRKHILSKMKEGLSETRTEMSVYAPRIETVFINPEKIKDVIGSGGKIIKEIVAKTGCKIDIEDTGKVSIASADGEAMKRAVQWVKDLTAEAEIGKIYSGKVVRIAEFGAFVEIMPGKDGLVHISELEPRRVEKVEDVVRLGDEIMVKVIDIDDKGKIRLSRKQVIDPTSASSSDDGGRGGRGGDRDRGPRGGGDRDRGPRSGGDRDRGPRSGGGGSDRGPRSGGGDRPPRGDRFRTSGDRPEKSPAAIDITGAQETLPPPVDPPSYEAPRETPAFEAPREQRDDAPAPRFDKEVEDELR